MILGPSIVSGIFKHIPFLKSARRRLNIISTPAGIAVLASGPSATLAYLVDPYLNGIDSTAVYLNIDSDSPESIVACGCHTVIVVRYLSAEWAVELRRFRNRGGYVIYLMDDDLMDSESLHNLPKHYAKKIRRSSMRWRTTIEEITNEFWVPSRYLADKYKAWSPRLIAACPGVRELSRTSCVTICYHGSASHQAELKWLAPVIERVQAANAHTHFEIFGDHSINRLYRDIPRVAVLHPMSWSNYLHYTASTRKDIALAPLMPDPFNAARTSTKFFDFARMGAVGIYSDRAPYRDFVRTGVDGVLLSDDPVVWCDAINNMVSDHEARLKIASSAQKRAADLAWNSSYVDLHRDK